MTEPGGSELLDIKVDVHDRRQFELKLEYQPSGTDSKSEYVIEALLFIPKSLNIGADTWPKESFYADLHNYVRLKTPVLSYEEILSGRHSPLQQIEERLVLGLLGSEAELVYDAKMLACVFRAALRRFSREIRRRCADLSHGGRDTPNEHKPSIERFESFVRSSMASTQEVLRRYRVASTNLATKYGLEPKTRTALRLVDEYLSLQVEQCFRRAVANMEGLFRGEDSTNLRRDLMSVVLADEAYRKAHRLPSVLTPDTDNEQYAHRLSFLKKFCQNILFLRVQRSSPRKAWEELLFSLAAGGAMAFALGVGLFAQTRYPQASFNFFVIAVLGYMLKDRIKEALRRVLASYAGRFLFERTTRIIDPVTQEEVGVCSDRVDYADAVHIPEEIVRLRQKDDLTAAAQGELGEMVIRYRKQIALESDMLPLIGDGIVTGVTDIIRINVEKLLRDMDDPEYEVDYIGLDDLSVEKLRLAKCYHVDLAVRSSVDDGKVQRTTVRVVRLVLDRNGIKRMSELVPETVVADKHPHRAAANG